MDAAALYVVGDALFDAVLRVARSASGSSGGCPGLAGGPLLTLAPQQLVDCAPNPQQCGGTGGCQGSTQPLAFNYTVGAGMDAESACKPRHSPPAAAPRSRV